MDFLQKSGSTCLDLDPKKVDRMKFIAFLKFFKLYCSQKIKIFYRNLNLKKSEIYLIFS